MKGRRLPISYGKTAPVLRLLRPRSGGGCSGHLQEGPWVLYEKLKTLKKSEDMCGRMLFLQTGKCALV